MKKVVIIGPESTGKSTLCADLANYFNCSFLPEFARQYLEEYGSKYSYEDVLKMSEGQAKAENAFEAENPDIPYLLIDTNQYVYKVWIEEKYGKYEPLIESLIKSSSYDYYFLCDIDCSWEYDEFREHPLDKDRKRLFKRYEELLNLDGTPFKVLSGNQNIRLSKAVSFLKKNI